MPKNDAECRKETIDFWQIWLRVLDGGDQMLTKTRAHSCFGLSQRYHPDIEKASFSGLAAVFMTVYVNFSRHGNRFVVLTATVSARFASVSLLALARLNKLSHCLV